MENHLTLAELAHYLGLSSTGSLRTQIKKGVLKAERVGKRTFIVSREEAERYQREHRSGFGKPGRRVWADYDALRTRLAGESVDRSDEDGAERS